MTQTSQRRMGPSFLTALVWLSALAGCSGNQGPSALPAPTGVGERWAVEAPFDKTANKVALLVGINDYQAVTKLSGCVNDARNIYALLVDDYGFPAGNIRVLTDGAATRAGVLNAFREHLIGNAGKDTVVVFHYSGHGSQMKDPANQTPSGMIGTIVPVDSRTEGVYDINADELRALFGELTGHTKNVTFVLDSCHSGLAFKDVAVARSVEPDTRVPPRPAVPIDRSRDVEGFKGRDYALLSACRADEVAFEYGKSGAPCGTLTHFLAAELRSVRKQKTTYRDVMDKVKAQVTGTYRLQHPQLEGVNMDNLVFSTEAVGAGAFVLASPQQDGVVLEAGLVHGVTAGSVYDVYVPGTKTFDDPGKAVARVEVTQVEPTRALAKRIRGDQIEVASRAVERSHNYEGHRIRVYLDEKKQSATLGKIREALKGNAKTDPNNPKAPTFVQAFEEVTGPEGVRLLLREELDDQKHTVIAIRGADGSERSPPVPSDDPKVVDRILGQLTAWAKWFNVLDLSNPRPELAVDFQIRPVAARDPELEGLPDLTLLDNQDLAFSVTNHSGKDVYFAILDLSSAGKIGLVYPGEGRNDALAAGGVYKDKVPVSVPNGRKQIIDYLKLVVTESPVDFRFVLQPGIKAPSDDPLSRLLDQAVLFEQRDVGNSKQTLGGWATSVRIVEVVTKEK
jgi:hypothetical protein